MAETLSTQTLHGFCDYVLDFYGPVGLYPMGATREQVEGATRVLLTHLEANGEEFQGDSYDREIVRDLLIARCGLVFPRSSSGVPVENPPPHISSARETADELWKAQIKLVRFRSWQTNYPGSRPELVPEIDQLMASISAVCQKLEGRGDD
jgi:hypothetical protein